MRKKKDSIIYNYEGIKVLNEKTGEWFIDFPKDVKELLLECLYKNNVETFKILACKGLTITAAYVLHNYSELKSYLPIEQKIEGKNKEDMKFFIYKLCQLLNVHDGDDIVKLEVATGYALNQMDRCYIDLINEMGDIYAMDLNNLKNFQFQRLITDVNPFVLNTLFKSDVTKQRITSFLRHLHFFDERIF